MLFSTPKQPCNASIPVDHHRNTLFLGKPFPHDGSQESGYFRHVRDAGQLITDNYIARGRKTLVDTQRRIDKHLTPFFGGKQLTEISTPLIRNFITARQAAKASNASRSVTVSYDTRFVSLR